MSSEHLIANIGSTYEKEVSWRWKMKHKSNKRTKKLKQKLIDIDTDNRMVVTGREEGWREGKLDVKYVVMEGNYTFGNEHIIEYTYQIIMLYTWNRYNVINQCYLNKFNF